MKRLSQQKFLMCHLRILGTDAITLIILFHDWDSERKPILFPGGFIQPLFRYCEPSRSSLPSLPDHSPRPQTLTSRPQQARGLWVQLPGMYHSSRLQHPLHLPPGVLQIKATAPKGNLKKKKKKKNNQKNPKKTTPAHTKLISVQTEDQDFKASQERQSVNSSDVSQAPKHLPGIVFIYF